MFGSGEIAPTEFSHAELLRDLQLLRKSGLRQLRQLVLPALNATARIVDLDSAADPDAGAVEALLRQAVGALGDDDAGKAARHLFGLERGAQLVHPTSLRQRAARAYGLRPETFRKEPERRLLSRIAEEILLLCRTAGSIHQPLMAPAPPVSTAPGTAASPSTPSAQAIGDAAGNRDDGVPATQSAMLTAARDAHVVYGTQTIVYGDQVTSVHVIQAAPQPLEPVRYGLPPDVPAFSGRERELHEIVGAGVKGPDDGETPATGGVVTIHAIDGMPGIGKTALAVHAAHLLGAEGPEHGARFPDGQLYLDLRAYTGGQEAIAPAEALATLLLADGVDPLYMPSTLDERSTLWRNRLTGRKVLLVLDNAADSAQVAPLIPGSPGCLTLVTSRRRLGDLAGVVNVLSLDVLAPDEARAMFLDLSGCRPGGGREVSAGTVSELAEMAGHLPLAISLLAKVFRQHRTWSMADLLAETHDRLLTMTAENASLKAAFDLSYELLPPLRQRFLRRIALHPGTDLDDLAAAVLSETSRTAASRMLEELYRDHLLIEIGYRRYGLHDLIRTYLVASLLKDPGAEREQALTRLLDYYLYATEVANRHLARQTRPYRVGGSPSSWRPVAGESIAADRILEDGLGAVTLIAGRPPMPAETPELPDRLRALTWVRAERANLLAVITVARRIDSARALALTAALADLLRLDGPWEDAATIHSAAAQLAARIGDWFGEAEALSNLGHIRLLSGDFAAGGTTLVRARDLFNEHGERLGEANAISGLGDLQLMVSEYDEATQIWRQALDLYRALNDRRGEANTLTDLGKTLYRVGDTEGAAEAMKQALALHRELGNLEGEAFTLTNLAIVHYRAGRPAEAVRPLKRAVELDQEIGDLRGEANALTYLGAALRTMGDHYGAIEVLNGALGLHRGLGYRLGVANTMLYIGHATMVIGDRLRAEEILHETLALYRDLDHRLGEPNTLLYLGVLHRDGGNLLLAQADLHRCLTLYRQIRDTGGEMEALNEIGTLNRMQGDLDRAVARHEEALQMSRNEKSAWDEALAIAGLARCARERGQAGEAGSGLLQALEILHRIGVPEAPETKAITAEFAALAADSLPDEAS